MIKIGADPELFVFSNAAKQFVSSHDLMPGSKAHPHKVHCGAVQVDGVAAEFNIDPVTSREHFLHNIDTVMVQLGDILGPDYRLVATPTATFDSVYFDSLPEVPKELGCTPDYNAYTKKANKPPKTDRPFRTGAGHVHVGWASSLDTDDYDNYLLCCSLVKQLDATLFFNSLLWDADESRRTLYGKMGSFRPKSYGLEYRPMSNAWLNDPQLVLWVYDATVRATELFFEGILVHEDRAFLEVASAYMRKDADADDIRNYVTYVSDIYGIPPLPEAYR